MCRPTIGRHRLSNRCAASGSLSAIRNRGDPALDDLNDTEEYREQFRDEIRTRLEALRLLLRRLSGGDEASSLVTDAFREAHTVKGLASMVRFQDAYQLSQALEDLLGAARDRQLPLSGAPLPLLMEAVDQAEASLETDLPSGAATATASRIRGLSLPARGTGAESLPHETLSSPGREAREESPPPPGDRTPGLPGFKRGHLCDGGEAAGLLSEWLAGESRALKTLRSILDSTALLEDDLWRAAMREPEPGDHVEPPAAGSLDEHPDLARALTRCSDLHQALSALLQDREGASSTLRAQLGEQPAPGSPSGPPG